jgi:hypothetical protein
VGVGTLGWLGAAIGSLVVAHDVASAGICIVMATAFGSLGVYLTRTGRRLQRAEEVLEEQLRCLEGPEAAAG